MNPQTAGAPFRVFSEHHTDGDLPVSTHATLERAEFAALEWNGLAWIENCRGHACGTFQDRRRNAAA